jgi:hypothetical protein
MRFFQYKDVVPLLLDKKTQAILKETDFIRHTQDNPYMNMVKGVVSKGGRFGVSSAVYNVGDEVTFREYYLDEITDFRELPLVGLSKDEAVAILRSRGHERIDIVQGTTITAECKYHPTLCLDGEMVIYNC